MDRYYTEQITNVLTQIFYAPLHIKFMIFIMIKNICIGVYKGIQNFRTADNPVTQLFGFIVTYTLWGYIVAIFWPITIPLFVLSELDEIAKLIMKK